MKVRTNVRMIGKTEGTESSEEQTEETIGWKGYEKKTETI